MSVKLILLAAIALVPILTFPSISLAQAPVVEQMRTPDGGIQPQAIIDSRNTLHLVYYVGDPGHGDVYYVHRDMNAGSSFSRPIRVNSDPSTAIAIGAIRGAQIAMGRNGRIYVVWNGVGPVGASGYARLYTAFTRLADDYARFEPQRNLLPQGEQVDGGCSVAADRDGDVYVAWHNSPTGNGEAGGGAFLARSADDGVTFSTPQMASAPGDGQCGCCSMKAFADRTGTVYLLYRTAGQSVHRDTTLLVSHDRGITFRPTTVDRWTINACPMSMFSLANCATGTLAAWESQGQVSFASFNGSSRVLEAPAPGSGRRKYPVAVQNSAGDTLLAWVDGAGWGRGNSGVNDQTGD